MKMTRRFFALLLILIAPLLLSVVCVSGDTAKPSQYFALVGTYTSKTDSKGIYSFHFDSGTGRLTAMAVAATTQDPSFLTVAPNEKYLYAVNELGEFDGKKSGAVTSYSLDPKSGQLSQLNQVASGGADPCYISFDGTGKYLLVANYSGGSVSTFPVASDGHIEPASAFVQHSGSGPNKERQEGPHAHFIASSADNRFVFVVDLGLDEVVVYHFDSASGSLIPNHPPFAKLAPGAGPRHLAFHPNGKFAYVLSEVNSTVTAFAYDAENGSFSTLQTLSTIPKDFKTRNDTAEIVVHPSGKFLYASNRGHDSIAEFTIDPTRGTLSLAGDFPTQGKEPRNFTLDPTGKFLLAANQESNNIVVFRIDQSTGALITTGQVAQVPAPVEIVFVHAK
ncbi:MAG TPA: lactonase family protein [Verrucomicrobiae bacterium]|jgi:6-phosphogluconolactonase|nr:lactonase family protein [Verrucomicrobiae bacterium]